LKNEGSTAASYLAADVCTPNLNGISQAKSNYWASKYDTNGRSCELECQLTLKNEGRTVASYLAADVCKPNLKGISQAKSNYWASKYDTNGRNFG
jgi:hypothetical protein